jgi:Holliday junction resolvasome RuvABC endonuclease subunit
VDTVYVEEPIAGRSVRVSLQIAQMAGAVLSAVDGLHNADGELSHSYLVSNTAWKKLLIGSGNANKEKIRKWLDTEFPSYASKCGSDQDRYDATCIALYGERQQLLAAHLREGKDVFGTPALPDGQALA